jgi:hypothetical protein
MVTEFFNVERNTTMFRGNFFHGGGYSTLTFPNRSDAESWVRAMRASIL